jgi:glycosyltransferase involved in cell wall biosynthesis
VADLVSFCVPNHNYGRFLRPLIDALLAQTYDNVEVIVVDDGSTDDSRHVLAEYEGRIVVELQPQSGQAAACNRAFALSHGDIVVFHDSDDMVYPDAAERLVEAFEDPKVTMVMSRLEIVDAEGRRIGARRPPDGCPLWGGDLRSLVLDRCSFFWPETTGQAYRRSFVDAVMPIPELAPPDGYFSYLAALGGPLVALEQPVACYRSHGANKHISPPVHGSPWLDERIEMRENLYKAMRTYGGALGVFSDAQSAQEWVPRDYIMASLRVAKSRLTRQSGRWRHAVSGARAIAGHPQFRLASQARHMTWFIGAAILPLPLARRSITARFPQAR